MVRRAPAARTQENAPALGSGARGRIPARRKPVIARDGPAGGTECGRWSGRSRSFAARSPAKSCDPPWVLGELRIANGAERARQCWPSQKSGLIAPAATFGRWLQLRLSSASLKSLGTSDRAAQPRNADLLRHRRRRLLA